jgi:hypothetical protein
VSFRFLLTSATLAAGLTLFTGAHAQGPQAAPRASDPALAGYFAVYQNPFVVGLRKELDGYLAVKEGKASKWHGQGNTDSPVMEFAELEKVDREYLSSRFTVYRLDPEPFVGG